MKGITVLIIPFIINLVLVMDSGPPPEKKEARKIKNFSPSKPSNFNEGKIIPP